MEKVFRETCPVLGARSIVCVNCVLAVSSLVLCWCGSSRIRYSALSHPVCFLRSLALFRSHSLPPSPLSEKLKLEQEVAANTQEVSQQESKFHLIQAMKRITEANLAKRECVWEVLRVCVGSAVWGSEDEDCGCAERFQRCAPCSVMQCDASSKWPR